MRVNRMRAMTVAAALAMAVAGCSPGDEEPSATTAVAAEDGAASPDTTEAAVGLDEDLDETEAAAEVPRVFPELPTEPAEPGPHPTLAWQPVDGAVVYEVVVLDADRSPYWAWSGPELSVSLGGVSDPDATGAWVFEPLTWTVQARGADGATLALSEPAQLLP